MFKIRRNSVNIRLRPFGSISIGISTKVATIAIVGAVIYALYMQFKPLEETALPYDAGEQVRACTDGDTFRYGDEKIRLLAVDTPETVKSGTEVQRFGPEASERTCNLVMNAETITFEYDAGNEIDKYGRNLYWVYIDGQLLQETLVKEGLAEIKYVDNKTVDQAKLKVLKEAEKDAQYNAIGIWGN